MYGSSMNICSMLNQESKEWNKKLSLNSFHFDCLFLKIQIVIYFQRETSASHDSRIKKIKQFNLNRNFKEEKKRYFCKECDMCVRYFSQSSLKYTSWKFFWSWASIFSSGLATCLLFCISSCHFFEILFEFRNVCVNITFSQIVADFVFEIRR